MLLEVFYYLTIRPLEMLFETVFFLFFRLLDKPFPTLIALSIFVNILVFPLYKRADKLQAEQRARERSMESRLAHIKKTFRGDEKVMMTQAYYRVCGYKPVYALRGASSLLLQIPFFISAYRFLSGLELLKGMPSVLLHLPGNGENPVYLIKDLGAPDGMINIGGVSVNLLPILMTLINIVSGTIYSKGHLRKEKIQLYVTALVFLVLLYNSPAGLVIYWTCNNIFSLLKNAVQKIVESRIPVKAASDNTGKTASVSTKEYDRVFLFSAFLMAVLTGLFIPSNVVSASATEFISILDIFNPARYLVYSFALGIGFFVVWAGIYYLFSTGRSRIVFSCLMMIVCACSVIDYLMSGSGLGSITAELKYDSTPVFSGRQLALNIVLIAVAAIAVAVLFRLKPSVSGAVVMAGCAALVCVSLLNVFKIGSDYKDYLKTHSSTDAYGQEPKISLSRTGKNVVLIMLDRAMGPQMMYMLNERPDLIETYDGFTFYHDTVSFGGFTNFAMPAVFGGYEYTPYEMNKRDDEWLADKTNEALRVLPVLFSDNGYGVTVFDPPYGNYNNETDLSIYDEYPQINKYKSEGRFVAGSDDYNKTGEVIKRNLYKFGEMKAFPLLLQGIMYNDGNYNYNDTRFINSRFSETTLGDDFLNTKISEGCSEEFYAWYTVLENMSGITEIHDGGNDEFLMMYNCTAHEPTILQLPDYKPAVHVNNTSYDMDQFYTINGITMNMDNKWRVAHYHSNMAALLRIGEWLEYLKAEGVYDNTRIIITSDHGRNVGWFDGFTFGENGISAEWYTPLLMVKDFDDHGFRVSTEFMTNADACVMAVSGDAVENKVNPFTGNVLDGHQKYEDIVRITVNEDYNISEFHGKTYTPGDWYTVNGSPYDVNNWQYLGYE